MTVKPDLFTKYCKSFRLKSKGVCIYLYVFLKHSAVEYYYFQVQFSSEIDTEQELSNTVSDVSSVYRK